MHSMAMQKPIPSKPFDNVVEELSNESLEKILPEGLVIDRAWLNAQGVSRSSIDYYLRAGCDCIFVLCFGLVGIITFIFDNSAC